MTQGDESCPDQDTTSRDYSPQVPDDAAAAGPTRRISIRWRFLIAGALVVVAAIGAITVHGDRPRADPSDASPVTGCVMQLGTKTFGGTTDGTCWAVYFGAMADRPLSFAMFISKPPGGYGDVDFEVGAGSVPILNCGFTLSATLSSGVKIGGQLLVLGPHTAKVVEHTADGASVNLPIASVAGWRVTAVVGDEEQIIAVDALDASGRSLLSLSGTRLWA